MPLTAFDHVNLRTPNLDAMIAWYGQYLDMHPGPRPDFGFPGAWLYLGDQPLIHLVGISAGPTSTETPLLEHFAFRATGMKAFLNRLTEGGVAYQLGRPGEFPIVQVNIHDPDGNHIHIDFDAAEMP